MGRFRSRHLVVLLLLLGASGSPTSAQTPEGSEVTLQGTKVAKGGSGVFGPSDIFRAPRGVCSENCESGKMSLVQSSVARRKAPGSALKPWDVRMYFVAEPKSSWKSSFILGEIYLVMSHKAPQGFLQWVFNNS